MTKLWLRVAGFAVAAASVLFLAVFVRRYLQEIPSSAWTWSFAARVGASALVFSLGTLVMALAWTILLRRAGQRVRYRTAAVLMAVSQIAKYMPGNVAHYVGRAALARTVGLQLPVVVSTMVVESLWVIAACALFAVPAVAAGLFRLAGMQGSPEVGLDSRGLLALALTAMLLPFLVLRVLVRRMPRSGSPWALPDLDRVASFRAGVTCLALYSLNFLVAGVSVSIIAAGLHPVGPSQFWVITGIFAASWLAGVATPGVPAGLGVRDAFFTAGMVPLIGGSQAVVVAAVHRVATAAADALVFGLGAIARARNGPQRPGRSTADPPSRDEPPAPTGTESKQS